MRIDIRIPAPPFEIFTEEAFDGLVDTGVACVVGEKRVQARLLFALVVDEGRYALLALEVPEEGSR